MPTNKCTVCGGVFHHKRKTNFCSEKCADRWAEDLQFQKFLDETAKEVSTWPEHLQACGKELTGTGGAE